MVTTKFLIELVLIIIGLAIILWWMYNNYSNIMTAFQNWIEEIISW